jgi:hypothetical protein
MKSPEMSSSPEQPKKRWKVLIEMEGYGEDGEEITGPDLYEEVTVEAMTADEANDVAANMDFGNRRVSYVKEPEEIKEEK